MDYIKRIENNTVIIESGKKNDEELRKRQTDRLMALTNKIKESEDK